MKPLFVHLIRQERFVRRDRSHRVAVRRLKLLKMKLPLYETPAPTRSCWRRELRSGSSASMAAFSSKRVAKTRGGYGVLRERGARDAHVGGEGRRDDGGVEREDLARGHAAALEEGDRFVVFALAEEEQAFQPRDVRLVLVAELLFSPREEPAERQSVIEALELVGDERGDRVRSPVCRLPGRRAAACGG